MLSCSKEEILKGTLHSIKLLANSSFSLQDTRPPPPLFFSRCIVKKPVEHFANINQHEKIFTFFFSGEKVSNQRKNTIFAKFCILIDLYDTVIQFNLIYRIVEANKGFFFSSEKFPTLSHLISTNLTVHDISNPRNFSVSRNSNLNFHCDDDDAPKIHLESIFSSSLNQRRNSVDAWRVEETNFKVAQEYKIN